MRVQIQFTKQQAETLRLLSAATGKSIAELIGQAVELYLRHTHDQQIERALQVAGKFSSARTDGSLKHDRHLEEAFRR